jgi:putative endonuclease
MNHNKDTGNRGENIAAEYLLTQNYSIMERNWRFSHWEVDIIASKGKKLHFVEVKTRTNEKYGKPEESIGREKMNCLKNAATKYVFLHPGWKYIQFDVLAITLKGEEVKEVFMIEDVYF